VRAVTRVALIATVAGVVACGSPSASPTGSAAFRTVPSAPIAERCPPIDLRTPSGEQINLNGSWVTEKEGVRGGIYYFRQVGECIWFVGGFPNLEADVIDFAGPLGLNTVLFDGRLNDDFTVTGDWIDGRDQFVQAGRGGTLDLAVVTDDAGVIHVVYIGGTGQPFIEPGYREEQSWVRISESGAYPPSR
jgi:hypothetical protein